MKNNDPFYLKDIIESLTKIEKYMHDVSDSEFIKNEEKQEAVLFNLQIIGEASSKLSKELKEKHPEVGWQKLTRLRNLIVHEYFNIEAKEVLYIIKNDLPSIKKQMLEIEKTIS